MSELQTFERDGRVFRVQVDEQHAWFWPQVRDDTWESETFTIFKQEITPETLYVDIGTWIGPTVLYGASLAKRVVAVEPDAVAMSALLKNLAVNPDLYEKTDLYNFALARDDGVVELFAHTFGDSMTSSLPSRGSHKMSFLSMAFEKFASSVLGSEKHVFMKVDTEGAEYELVPEICRVLSGDEMPITDLYISIHGSFASHSDSNVEAWAANLQRNARVLSCLASYGTIFVFDDSGWSEMTLPASGVFPELLAFGGIDTTLFVKSRRHRAA